MVGTALGSTSGSISSRFRGSLALLIALSVGACVKPSLPATSTTSVTIGTAIPAIRDPAAGVDALIDLLTLDAPVFIGWDGRPTPRAIDKWEWSPDGLTLRLHLRSGVVFHEGSRLTNTLAAEILKTALPASGAVSATIQSVTPEGADEIVIRTAQPEGFLLSDISLANFALPGHKHVGTGPYRLVSSGKAIALQAFDGFRTGRPAIDTVRISEYQTQRQAWAAMMRGEADVLHEVSVESLDFVEAESSVKTYSFVKAYYHALVFNLTLPLFANKDLRKALNEAVDRTQVVDIGLRKRGIPSDGPIWPYHFGRSSDQPAYTYDPARAEALLDSVGLTRGREQQAGKMPSRFRFTCLIPREDQRMQRIALVVQKQLFNVDVDMDVEVMPFREMQGRVFSGQFEAVLSEFAALRPLNFVYALWHSVPPGTKGKLDLHYSAADTALDKLRGALKEDDVRVAVADLQRAFYDDPPAVFLDWMQTARAVNRSVVIQIEPGRDIVGSIPFWRPTSLGVVRR
jgi:peptide/nickel transport system substrate-binding protein